MSATRPCSALMFALLLPVALLPLADLLRQLGQGDQLWQLLLAGAGNAIQEALPVLLAIALARGLERERLTSQPLNALLGYLVMSQTVAGLLQTPSQELAIPCALLSAWVSARAHPRLAKVRLPARLRIYTTDALILLQNALLCLLLALPLAGLWHWLAPELWALAREGIRWPQGDWLLGSLLPIMTLLGLAPKLLAHLALNGPSQAVQAAIAASTLVGLPVLGIQLLRAARRQQLLRHQGLWLLLLLACLASGHSQPMLLALLVFYRPLFWLHLLLGGLVMTLSLSLAAQWHWHQGGLLSLLWHPQSLQANAAGWLLALLTLILSLLLSRLCLRWLPLIPLKEPEREPSAPVSADISLLAIDYLKAIGGLGNIVSVAAQQHYLQLEVEQPQAVDRHALLALGVLTQFDEQPQRLQLLAGPLAGPLAEKIQQLASRQSVDLQPRRFALRPYQLH